jgi:tRNA nucleotidyltransferase (CCA-adding enzyme)
VDRNLPALGEASRREYFRTLRECGRSGRYPEIDALFGVPQPERHHPEIDTGEHILLCLRLAAELGSRTARFAVLVHDLGRRSRRANTGPPMSATKLGAVAVRAL